MSFLGRKKVSFDIDVEILNMVKRICAEKEIKLSDFLREAVKEKLENERSYFSIYVPLDGKIMHFQIEKDRYDIEMWEASDSMKIHVGAKCEGTIKLKEGFKRVPRAIWKRPEEDPGNPEKNSPLLLDSLLLDTEQISFYTTKQYC